MRLPNGDRALIASRKIRDYLLSPDHPVGRFKAAWFSRLGFTQEAWQGLSAELRRVAAEGKAESVERTAYGQKYAVRATINGLAGRIANVVSIWIILDGEEVPRFVTAFPEKGP